VEVVDLMFRLNREHGTTLLLVTHDSHARVALRAAALARRGPARRRRARASAMSRSIEAHCCGPLTAACDARRATGAPASSPCSSPH
jgi:hypothetical protein